MDSEDPKLICDGELEIVKITEDLYDQSAELHQKYFMKYENISIALNLLGSQQSTNEMDILVRESLKDGVSFGAKHRKTNELVAICVNIIVNPAAGCTLDNVVESFKSPAMLSVADYLERMERSHDLFSEWQIDCLLEILFLSTRTDFGKKGIASALSEHSIEFARNMKNGTLYDRESLPAHVKDMKPKAVSSIFTSRFSQRVGEKLGWQVINKISHKDFKVDGKTFADKIDARHEFSIYAAMRL